jgi:hypothetical protein
MPGEDFRISNGDLWTREDSRDEWHILRRPAPVMEAQWRAFDRFDPRYARWRPDAAARGWRIEGRSRIAAHGSGSASFPESGALVDRYADGYPGRMGPRLARARIVPNGTNHVGDLRLTGELRAEASCRRIVIELAEGERRYRFELPGPAAPAEERPRIVVHGAAESLSTQAGGPWRLPAGASLDFSAQNLDDRLALSCGELELALEIPEASDQRSSITLHVEGDAAFEDLEVWRDIYYTADRGRSEFTIPPGCYLMLGDNTLDSSDSREWTLDRYRLRQGDETWWRGNLRQGENPLKVTGEPGGPRYFFRDEWGELHTFLEREMERGEPVPCPFVPRELVVGRAVLVFWPNWPFDGLGVWRLKWVR